MIDEESHGRSIRLSTVNYSVELSSSHPEENLEDIVTYALRVLIKIKEVDN